MESVIYAAGGSWAPTSSPDTSVVPPKISWAREIAFWLPPVERQDRAASVQDGLGVSARSVCNFRQDDPKFCQKNGTKNWAGKLHHGASFCLLFKQTARFSGPENGPLFGTVNVIDLCADRNKKHADRNKKTHHARPPGTVPQGYAFPCRCPYKSPGQISSAGLRARRRAGPPRRSP